MKRIVILMLSICFIFSLSSCSGIDRSGCLLTLPSLDKLFDISQLYFRNIVINFNVVRLNI